MENKINIAGILKDCPKGTKLYSPLVGECTLEHIHGELKKILISTSDGTTLTFNNNGTYFQMDNSECLLFPSKDQRDWSKFQKPFKDGDILISGLEDNPFIFKRINGLGNAQCYCAISCFGQLILNNDNWTYIKGCRLATEEEKQKLFDAIKVNGYKWNTETKTLEKLSKFKVGDKIQHKNGDNLAQELARIMAEIAGYLHDFHYEKVFELNDRQRLGAKIMALRNERGYSIRTLAELCDVNKATIVNIEQGRFSPRFDIVEKICHVLGAKIEIK